MNHIHSTNIVYKKIKKNYTIKKQTNGVRRVQ